jgi:hypothetical protein
MDDRWKDYINQNFVKLKNDVMDGNIRSWYSGSNGNQMTRNNNVHSFFAGVVAFGSINALSCWIQGSILGVSTGTIRPIPTISGVATIATASYVAHSTAICSNHYRMERQKHNRSVTDALKVAWKRRPSILNRDDMSIFWTNNSNNNNNPYLHTMRVCVVGLLCFKLLGGRFWSIAPSSYTHVGSYARGSIAATDQYATPTQRLAIQRLGRIFGCHTCGRKPFPFLPSSSIRFIGDHQPPKSVAYQLNQQLIRRLFGQKVPFRFYPHCMTCSNKQGGILATASFDLAKTKSWNHWWKYIANKSSRSPNINVMSLQSAGGGANAYIHGLQPRLYHLTGGVIAMLATADNDQGRQRYLTLQSHFTKMFGRPYDATTKYIHQQIQHHISIQRFSIVWRKRIHQLSMKQLHL